MANRDFFPVFDGIDESDRFLALPDDTCRTFWFLLGVKCDSWGRATADPGDLDRKVWPKLLKGAAETERCLKALADARLVSIYRTAGRTCVQFGNWELFAGMLGHPERRGLSRFPDPRGFVAPARWLEKHPGRPSPWIGAQSGLSPDLVQPKSGRSSPARGEDVRGRDRARDSKSSPQDPGALLPDGGPDRPSGAGRPPATAGEKQPRRGARPALVNPERCPHCRGPVHLELLLAETKFCTLHDGPPVPIDGVQVVVCGTKRKPACREFVGRRKPFGPCDCLPCTAKSIAAARASA